MADGPESAKVSDASLDIEREKLAVERAKLDIEREKLAIDRQKARWTVLAIVIPLLAIVATIWAGLLQQYLKARDDSALKAAEIVMAAQDSHPSMPKRQALGRLLPDRFGATLPAGLEPEQSDETGRASIASKKELLAMLAAHPGQHAAIVAYWKAVFPNDEWVVPLQRAVQANEGKKVARSVAAPRPTVSISPPSPARRDVPGVMPKDTGAGGMGFELPPSGSQPESSPGIGPGDEPGIMR